MSEPLSVLQTQLVHNVHRRATTMLVEAAADPAVPVGALATLREFLVSNLHHHHETEDNDLWPLIKEADPEAALRMTELTGEHNILDEALETLLRADLNDREFFTGAAEAVRDVVHRHLVDEEPVLLPALRDHLSPEAWNGFAAHVAATAPTAHRHLMIGFMDLAGTGEQIEVMLGALPLPLLARLRDEAKEAFASLQGRA
ncbi:hemerythrin domain-containing protein [Actinoplanes sp. TBRC 11911]|uniref:hemerythrin domain-containing protein n=1 Tax=Actinoplanes sp. TBRC 11911 TaxID=2729386 RepID=UPI00145D67DB|nr:hemerythrin domain-containing protein [Actinoplanes sp. TBRC 11911]NMO55653.1 hemerythrin domain-containing protein [Actinoplanes sp. TBRC 11911]